jgi:hypothetical protein
MTWGGILAVGALGGGLCWLVWRSTRRRAWSATLLSHSSDEDREHRKDLERLKES